MIAADQAQQIDNAIAKLKSFRDGDFGVLEVIACGGQAIPALCAVLFEREPSGLYQARCRAVEALAALGAHDELIEFLEAERTITDAVERLGEDAVINAAALALANARDPRVFALLLRLARRPALTGIIGALGKFEKVEAIPALIDALEEDASRLVAEGALRKLGRSARAALLRTLEVKGPSGERESESSARRRRSALRLLAEMDRSRQAWRQLRHFVDDKDAKLAALACEIGLSFGSTSERTAVVRRLIELLSREDWLVREEIESCLLAHFDSARQVIACRLSEAQRPGDDVAARTQIESILRRIVARAESAAQPP